MVFILLLVFSTLAVAGSAAFFSVYGLAQIFSASFIPVVIMGGALEAGKLVAASYLYRYWKETSFILKTYLFIAIFTLMVITSLGIFGFLTAAYQTDSIGLKQQREQTLNDLLGSMQTLRELVIIISANGLNSWGTSSRKRISSSQI
jgi:hypothetical protein